MKSVLVTGGSSGIGLAVAKAFLKNNYDVTVTYNNNLEGAKASGARYCKCDVRNSDEVKKLFEFVKAESGKIDILVNCAGISENILFDTISDKSYREMISTNLDGVFFCCREAAKDMLTRKSGRIINISSMWGKLGASMEVHYSASKGGVDSLTKALAKELAPSGITVNAVAPGAIDTKMMSHYSKEDIKLVCEEIPMGRLGKPEEVASLVLFLADDCAAYITGQIIGIDGGMT